MGFQAAMVRSGSRGEQPIIAWITPSDATNLALKTSSALAQGAKHFFYWTYGPTATSTENYWSDLRGEYDGIVRMTRHLASAEHIIAPGVPRKTRVALLYSISADLWQPWGYIHMLERRATYLALVHDHYLVDMLTEEDVAAGRLADYDVLYTVDPNISTRATTAIEEWVRDGGYVYGACGAGSRDEFNEPTRGLGTVFGIEPAIRTEVRPEEYRVRGSLNWIDYFDRIRLDRTALLGERVAFGVLGLPPHREAHRASAAGQVPARWSLGGARPPAVRGGSGPRGASATGLWLGGRVHDQPGAQRHHPARITGHVRARGYPPVRADRSQHPASRLACVADAFDAMNRYPGIGPRATVVREAGQVNVSRARGFRSGPNGPKCLGSSASWAQALVGK